MPAPSQRPQAQQDAIDTALQVVKTIDNLAQNEDFGRFMERFSRRSNQMAIDILNDDSLSPEEREKLRNKRLGIQEVLLSLNEDRDAQLRVLAQYGITP